MTRRVAAEVERVTVQDAEATAAAPAAAGSLARTTAAGLVGGAVCGALVGGVLGRLAMRLLAVTSPDSALYRLTDDDAIVGEISVAGTLSLLAFTASIGAIGGLLYLWVARVLPATPRGRVAGFGLLTGTLGGALFVHGHGSFDYTVLRPVWLAVALFVALPSLFGVAVPLLVDTLAGPRGWVRRGPWWLVAPATVIAAVQPAGLVVFAAGYGVALTISTVPVLHRWWHGRVVTVLGSTLLGALVCWGVYGLAVDIVSLVQQRYPTAPFNP